MLIAEPRRSASWAGRLTLKGELRRALGLPHVCGPGEIRRHPVTGHDRRPHPFAGDTRNALLVQRACLSRAPATLVAREEPRDGPHLCVARPAPCDSRHRVPWLDARPRVANGPRPDTGSAMHVSAGRIVRSAARCSRDVGESDRSDDRAHRPRQGHRGRRPARPPLTPRPIARHAYGVQTCAREELLLGENAEPLGCGGGHVKPPARVSTGSAQDACTHRHCRPRLRPEAKRGETRPPAASARKGIAAPSPVHRTAGVPVAVGRVYERGSCP